MLQKGYSKSIKRCFEGVVCVCGRGLFKGTPLSRCLSGLDTNPEAFVPPWRVVGWAGVRGGGVCAVDASSKLCLRKGTMGNWQPHQKEGREKLALKGGKGQLWHVQMCAAAVQRRHRSRRGAVYFIIY